MAIISEHEAMVQKPSYDAPESEDLVKKINELLTRAKRYRKRYDSDWHYNYEFVCGGRQWSQDRAKWRFSETVNVLWASIQTEIALQTDARPKFEFVGQEFSDEAFAKALKQVNDRNWDKYKWNTVVSDGLFDCKIYHVAHAIVEWDPELEYGLGDVSFKILDPFYCYWDPRASDVNRGQRARWFQYCEPVPTSELRLKYPDHKDKIKPDVSMMEDSHFGTTSNRMFMNYDPHSPSRLPSSSKATGDMYGGEPMTVLIRTWLRDDTMEEICEEKEENGEKKKEYILQKKYPNGRYIEIANNTVLFDGPQGVMVNGSWVPYKSDCFPIARLVNYQYPREYCGENEVTHNKGPQKIRNYVWSYILDGFKMMGNPVTVLGDGAGADEEEITNEPGSIIKAADVNQIRREPGVPLSPGALDVLNESKASFQEVQGLTDVSRGADTSNVTSAIQFEGYVEAAQTRPRMKNRNLDAFLQDCGYLMAERYMQFYTQPRVMRITNEEGFPETIEFQMDPNGENVSIRRTPDGETPGMPETHQIKGMPDIRVTSGSALPFAKAQKSQTALTYFNAGAIDREELLRAVDWANPEEVLKRMEEKEAMAAQAEARPA